MIYKFSAQIENSEENKATTFSTSVFPELFNALNHYVRKKASEKLCMFVRLGTSHSKNVSPGRI